MNMNNNTGQLNPNFVQQQNVMNTPPSQNSPCPTPPLGQQDVPLPNTQELINIGETMRRTLSKVEFPATIVLEENANRLPDMSPRTSTLVNSANLQSVVNLDGSINLPMQQQNLQRTISNTSQSNTSLPNLLQQQNQNPNLQMVFVKPVGIVTPVQIPNITSHSTIAPQGGNTSSSMASGVVSPISQSLSPISPRTSVFFTAG